MRIGSCPMLLRFVARELLLALWASVPRLSQNGITEIDTHLAFAIRQGAANICIFAAGIDDDVVPRWAEQPIQLRWVLGVGLRHGVVAAVASGGCGGLIIYSH